MIPSDDVGVLSTNVRTGIRAGSDSTRGCIDASEAHQVALLDL